MPSARPLRLVALALVTAAACRPVERPPGPLDHYTFPTGMALSGGRLFVVSSNFDLTYQDEDGGSVLVADPDDWIAGTGGFVGGLRMPSFGGEIAVATPDGPCAVASTQALVPSRLSATLYRYDVGEGGQLSCGPGCEIELGDPGQVDPFAVELVCRPGQPPRVFVGWLRTRLGSDCGENAASSSSCSALSEVRLDQDRPEPKVSVLTYGQGAVRQLRYDPGSDLLFFVTTGSAVGWVDLSTGCDIAGDSQPCQVQTIDLAGAIAGVEVRAVAVSSSSPRRLYLATRLYDTDAVISGVRIDVGGALVVLQLEPASTGGYDARLVRIVPLSTGVSQIVALPPRAGRADVVAVSASDDGEIWFYDDEVGAVTAVIGRDRRGVARVGSMPYGLVVEDRGATSRLYVGAFDAGIVTIWDVDPDAPEDVVKVGSIGG